MSEDVKEETIEEKIEEDIQDVDENSSTNIYEIGYILVPTIAEENLSVEVTKIKDFLEKQKASFISEEFPKMIELTYEMQRSIENKKQKFTNGYFGWVKFEVEKSQTKIIKETLDKNENIVRYIFIKTVRESTLSTRRSYNKGEGSKRTYVEKVEENLPFNEEVLDKEIEALVAE
jgi:ribosomal protein S6